MGRGRGRKTGRGALGVAVGAAALAGWAGAAMAVSGGGYTPGGQGCPPNSDSWSYHGSYPGCHSVNITVNDNQGHTYAEAGPDQQAQNTNLHSGTVMVTPNGDGNAYGDPNGTPSCPNVAANSTPPAPGQQETNQQCQGDPTAAPVSGPGAGASFDTNWQPLPSNDCGLQSAAVSIFGWLGYLGGGSQPCTVAPIIWAGPTTPLTSDPHDQGPFNPAAFTSPDASWVESIGLGWSPPDGAPSVGPWVRTGTSDATALDLLAGGGLYASGGDNVNTGEHDGMDGQYASGNVFDGSPDGGGMYLNWQPAAGADTMAGWASVITGVLSDRSPAGLAPVLENPVPVANAGFGAGFDGPYVGLYTSRQTMYQGGGGSNSSTNGQRDIYNYQEPNGQPKDWSPANCSNGSAAGEQACTTQPGSNGTTASCPPGETNNANDTSCGANYYKQQEASNVTSEPGVMVYNNPDPQSSGSNGTPGAYLGTCGAVVPTGAMDLPSAPSQAGPVAYTNSAGQTVVADPTGC